MPSSSITKSFVIKDEAALKRFNAEMEKQLSPPEIEKNKLSEGRKLLARYMTHETVNLLVARGN